MVMVKLGDNSTIDYTHIRCVSTEILTTDFSITHENTTPRLKIRTNTKWVWLQEVRNSTPYLCISLASLGDGSRRIPAETAANAIFILFSKKKVGGVRWETPGCNRATVITWEAPKAYTDLEQGHQIGN